MVDGVCDAIVPGSARVRPEVYVDAKLARMPEGMRAAALAAFASLAEGDLAAAAGTPDFLWIRALAIEAFYSDFVAPGVEATRRVGRDRLQHSSRHAAGEGLVLPGHRMSERFDVVVVGSGAGGGIVAGELAERGRRVLLLECGPHLHRGRLHALGGEGHARPVLADALRADRRRRRRRGRAARRSLRRRLDDDQHEGGVARARQGSRQVACGRRPDGQRRRPLRRRPTSRRTTTASRRASACASATTGRRACSRSRPPSRRSARELESVRSYTDGNCMRCGSCLQGCPTNAGKSTLNTYIHDAWAAGSSSCAPARTSSAS